MPNSILDQYRDAAQAQGFEPSEITDFEGTAIRCQRAGIMPSEVADAVDAGRIVFNFDTDRVEIDGR